MDRFYRQFCSYSPYEDPVARYARAAGIALILFGIFAPHRFGFFWVGVVLSAVSGML
jgi:hypothetical protein